VVCPAWPGESAPGPSTYRFDFARLSGIVALMRATSSLVSLFTVGVLSLGLLGVSAGAEAQMVLEPAEADERAAKAAPADAAAIVAETSAPGRVAPVRAAAPAVPLEPTPARARSQSALEVALEAEAVWRASRVAGASKFGGAASGPRGALLDAAKARAELGHNAHAVAYLEEYLDDGHGDPEAERMLARLVSKLVPVEIEVDADPRDSAITVEIDFFGKPSDVLPPLVLQLTRDEGSEGVQRRTVLLTPGKWNVAVPEDGYYDGLDEDVEVVAGSTAKVDLLLRADMPAGDRPAFIGLRAASSPFFMGAVGVGLLSGGQVQYRRVLGRTNGDCSANIYHCRELLTSAVTLRSTGTALLGASLGVGTALLSGLAPTRRQRAIIWGVEAGVGLGALVGGAIGVSFAAGDFNGLGPDAWEGEAYRDSATSAAARHSGSAFALGFGTSMLVYSVYYLFRDQLNAHVGVRKRRRDRGRVFALTPGGGAGRLGGGLVARF